MAVTDGSTDGRLDVRQHRRADRRRRGSEDNAPRFRVRGSGKHRLNGKLHRSAGPDQRGRVKWPGVDDDEDPDAGPVINRDRRFKVGICQHGPNQGSE
jgi:hypothetical protein